MSSREWNGFFKWIKSAEDAREEQGETDGFVSAQETDYYEDAQEEHDETGGFAQEVEVCSLDSSGRGREQQLSKVDEESVDNSSNDSNDHDSAVTKGRHTFTRIRQRVGSMVNSSYFQNFIILLIIINAIMMGVGTFDFVTEDPAISAAFEKTDLAFLVIFTVELAMQFIYHGFRLFLDGWLVFDFVIIIISWSLSSLQIIRAFRIFRALRLLTRVEVLRNLVSALLDVLPRLTAITALLLLVFYIFAVMFTVLFKDLDLSEDYFVRLDASFFTLLQIMTLDWVNPARECMEVYSWAWAPFVIFVMISAFIVYNLIIAVVCDAVAMVEHGDGGDTFETPDDGDEGESSGAHDAAHVSVSLTKIRSLRNRIDQLKQNELKMQKSIDTSLRQLGIEVPL